MKLRKILGLVLAFVLTVSLGSAVFADAKGANVDPANTQKTDETIVIGLSAEPSALWAGGTGKAENEMQIIQNALQDTLVTVDRNTGDVLPNLATAWEWVDDTHCKFTLRDDVIMTDGSPLVADDVAYSFNVFMEYSANSDTGRFLAEYRRTSSLLIKCSLI